MKRRFFIKDVLVGATMVSIASFPILHAFDDSNKVKTHPFINDYLSDEDISDIVSQFVKENGGVINSNVYLEEEIIDLIIEDFNHNNTVLCGGWILSKNEIEYLVSKQQNYK